MSFVPIKLLFITCLVCIVPGLLFQQRNGHQQSFFVQCQQYNDGNDGNDGYYYDNNNDPSGSGYGYDNVDGAMNNNYPPGSNLDDGTGGGASGEDNLYYDYAERQYSKEIGPNDGTGGGSGIMNGWLGTITKVSTGGVIGWIVGSKYHTNKLSKKLYNQHKADQKKLYTQYYNDVYTLQKQNSELIDALEQYIMASGGTLTGGSNTDNNINQQQKLSSTSTTGSRRR